MADELRDLIEAELPTLLTTVGYHPRGLPSLRTAIAEHYCRTGLPTVPEQILVTTGATQGIGLTAQLYVRRNALVIVESPSWPGCLDLFTAAGARLLGIPLDADGIRIDALGTAINEHHPDLLFVMPTFHNPTGTLMSTPRRRRLAELADRHHLPIWRTSPISRSPVTPHRSRPTACRAPSCSRLAVWPRRSGADCASAGYRNQLRSSSAWADSRRWRTWEARSWTKRWPPGCWLAAMNSSPAAPTSTAYSWPTPADC